MASYYDESLLNDSQDDVLAQAAEATERQAQYQQQLGGNPLATQRGRLRFVPEPLHERVSPKFGVHERVVRLRPVLEGQFIARRRLTYALTQGLRGAVEEVLEHIDVPDADRFYISLGSERLHNASNAFFVTAGEWRRDGSRAQALLEKLGGMLNLNENFELDDSFNLSVVHVQAPPRGSGRKRSELPGHQSLERQKELNHKIFIPITPPEDGWCAPQAIVAVKGYLEATTDYERKKWKAPDRSQDCRQRAAEALA